MPPGSELTCLSDQFSKSVAGPGGFLIGFAREEDRNSQRRMVCFISGAFIALGHLTALENRAPAVSPSPGGDQKDTEWAGCSSGSGHIWSAAVAAARCLLCM